MFEPDSAPVSDQLDLADVGLNDRQREAVTFGSGPLLVVAGPGSGKTRVLVHRVAHLLQSGVSPFEVLAVTFTNKAAEEMRDRLTTLVGESSARRLWVATFHSVCVRILRSYPKEAGLRARFQIMDSDDTKAMFVRACTDTFNQKPDGSDLRTWLKLIDSAQNMMWTPDRLAVHDHPESRRAAEAWVAYENAKTRAGTVDYNDLLIKAVKVLRAHPEIRDRYQQRLKHVLVDEYQDTNLPQYELVKLLTGYWRNVTVVGDLDQCHPAGQLIETTDGQVPVQDLVGHTLVTPDGPVNRFGLSVRTHDGDMFTVTTPSGTVQVTPGHRFWVHGEPEPVPVEDLNSDSMQLQGADGDPVPFALTCQSGFLGDVYSLSVPGPQRYVAAGVVVANCIYGFRGASDSAMRNFTSDFPDAHVVTLDQNYRSTSPILDVAMALISPNTTPHRAHLWTDQEGGLPVRLYEADEDTDEARFVADRITESSRPLSDFAVLYRTNAQSRSFEQELMARAVRYRLVGAMRFYDRAEIKDTLGWLRIGLHDWDELALRRTVGAPKRRLGAKALEQALSGAAADGITVLEWVRSRVGSGDLGRADKAWQSYLEAVDKIAAALTRGPAAAVEAVIDLPGFADHVRGLGGQDPESRVENLQELFEYAAQFVAEGSVPSDTGELVYVADLSGWEAAEAFMDHVALLTDADTDDSEEAVTLMTAHAAKGKEFPVVFAVGFEDGLYPHARSSRSSAGVAEERRLAFVAVSRAMQELYLTWARTRFVWGSREFKEPSPFLTDIQRLLVPVDRNNVELTDSGPVQRVDKSWREPLSVPAARELPKKREPVPVLRRPTGPAPRVDPARLAEGVNVKHATFGDGVVVNVDGSGDDTSVKIRFLSGETRTLLVRFAPLTLI